MRLYLWTRQYTGDGDHGIEWMDSQSRLEAMGYRTSEKDEGYILGPLTVVTLKEPGKTKKGRK